MFSPAEYQLVDFGDGRKLERFGPYLIDRPSPAAADMPRAQPELWSRATARFELQGDLRGGERGRWVPSEALPQRWSVGFGPLRFEVKPTDFGHLGVFPEQAANWDWIAEQVRARASEPRRVKMLNLFAHTGGSTLAAAQAGAEVVHVDSSKSAVAWARRNAELSELAFAPIRWIVEDAARFVRRELNRGNRYDAVILDPPSYGHGPAGETWKLEADLPALLAACAELTAGRCRFILLTCHTPSVTPATAEKLVGVGFRANRVTVSELSIACATGHRLSCGVFARWSAE
jgi:23S rRNA (cytosine1962-C5)-methyltransferase